MRIVYKWKNDQSGKDRQSHMLKYSLENNHNHVSFEDSRILRNGHTNSELMRKISEALFITELRLLVNT